VRQDAVRYDVAADLSAGLSADRSVDHRVAAAALLLVARLVACDCRLAPYRCFPWAVVAISSRRALLLHSLSKRKKLLLRHLREPNKDC